jgi:hypothetical protein
LYVYQRSCFCFTSYSPTFQSWTVILSLVIVSKLCSWKITLFRWLKGVSSHIIHNTKMLQKIIMRIFRTLPMKNEWENG